MGSGAILNVGYKTMLRAERAENFCDFSLVTFWSTLVANDAK